MLGTHQLQKIRETGLNEEGYSPSMVVGRGAYSLVLRHAQRNDLVVKLTCCEASVPFLQQLQAAPHEDFVTVHNAQPLGTLPGTELPVHLFVLGRLEAPTPAELEAVQQKANVATDRACSGASRAPRRGTLDYAPFMARYCQAFALLDSERQRGWELLAEHLREAANPFQSVDVLTPGNLLVRNGRLVFSDPLRIVRPS